MIYDDEVLTSFTNQDEENVEGEEDEEEVKEEVKEEGME